MAEKNSNQIYLLVLNVLVVFFLILFSNLGLLPLRMGDFVFLVILLLLTALYRPSWTFLFFVGTTALENINLAPLELGIAVRPYQLLGGVTLVALAIRFLTKRLNFTLAKFTRFDGTALLLGAASLLSIFNAPGKSFSLKQSIIMLSYLAFYFLVRNFLQSKEDLKKVLPFFLSSGAVVVLYSIWQNVRFSHGLSHFEVMPGRPNATFAEADWAGIFLVLLLAVLYAIIYFLYKEANNSRSVIFNFKFLVFNQFLITKFQIFKLVVYLLLLITYVALILTVARSAWVGAVGVTFVFLLLVFTQLKISYKSWQWKDTLAMKLVIVPIFALSIVIVFLFNLTSFQLGNRVQSTGSGLQEITIACENGTGDWKAVPIETNLTIEAVDELEQYHCQHIDLEAIESEAASGKFITTALRKDPNISVRSEIYGKSWELIKLHPILGIGWGSVSSHLGTDARGAGLNASNIFLETWLGAGLLGLASFVLLLFFALKNGIFLFKKSDEYFGLFIILGLVAIVVPNLFNSGIFLGFLWLFLGAAFIKK